MLGARRDDTGMYTLRVENEHGSDTADIDVVVMDVPTKPHGPLKISEVYGEGCTGTIAQTDTSGFFYSHIIFNTNYKWGSICDFNQVSSRKGHPF